MGIRIALGSRARKLMVEVMRGVAPAGVLGMTVGTVGALFATRLLSGFLFGVTPGDPLTYTAVAVFLLLSMSIASYLPARRVSRLDPAEVLRAE
jgi:ABC-type lipoprotein release transport system permease subunit